MKHQKLLQGIDTIIIRVSDIEKAKKWYQEKLDLTPVWEDQSIKLVVLDTGSPTSLTIWQTDKKIESNKETSSYPIFRTLDAKKTRQDLHSKGVNVGEVIDDNSVKYFLFYDLDGNILEACQVHE
jgi:catechol 2,3-dioxygenase-like lactoylglutathione lyase family enzyme